MNGEMITAEQVKAARALLGWTREQLADKAGLSRTAVGVCEHGDRRQSEEVVDAIQDALEAEGVEFLADGTPQLRFKQATWNSPPGSGGRA